jgi:hypothetical protein
MHTKRDGILMRFLFSFLPPFHLENLSQKHKGKAEERRERSTEEWSQSPG